MLLFSVTMLCVCLLVYTILPCLSGLCRLAYIRYWIVIYIHIHLPTSVAPVLMALFSESIRARRGLSSRVCAQVDAAKSKPSWGYVITG